MVSHGVESSQVILDKSARVNNQIFCLDRHRDNFCKKKISFFDRRFNFRIRSWRSFSPTILLVKKSHFRRREVNPHHIFTGSNIPHKVDSE